MEFSPEQKVLNDLFGNDLTYEIPSYQRPYSWSARGKSDKDNQVNTMWSDLIEHFETKPDEIYFMGSMVLVGGSTNRTFQVIDGQQRLTTLTLLFVAIKCMLDELKDGQIEKSNFAELKSFVGNAQNNINSILFNKKLFGVVEQEKKVKIQSIAGFDYDEILKFALECGAFKEIKNNCKTDEQKLVSERYFANRNYFKYKLQNRFSEENNFTFKKAQELNNFIEFLKNKVTVIRILSPRFEVAYQIFEILNNRGLPLSNKDLFRNFIISELYKANVAEPEKKWLALDEYEFTPEFISRYVESKKARKQKYSAFNDLQEIYQNEFEDGFDKKKVENFYDDVEKYLIHFTNIETLNFENKKIRHRVEFLKNSGNGSNITNLLLALFCSTEDENEVINFLSNFELYVLRVLLVSSARFSSKEIFNAITNLNSGSFEDGLNIISLKTKEDKFELSEYLELPGNRDNDLAKLLIARYLWAKDMDNPADVVNLNLDYKACTLEHIIPQNPDIFTNWIDDFSPNFRNIYSHSLGNMTLLTQKMNSKAKNYDFSKKKEIYQKMKLPMTVKIGNLKKIDEAFIEKRDKEITNYLIKHFGLEN